MDQLLFDATFTLICSIYIGICNKCLLTSSIFQTEYLFICLNLGFYAESQHAFRSFHLILMKAIFCDLHSIYNRTNSCNFQRSFFAGTQHVYEASFCYSRMFHSTFIAEPLISNFHESLTFLIFNILHNLISEGTTSL